MKLLKSWDTIRTSWQSFDLPPYLAAAARWVQRHPQAVVATVVIVALGVLLTQTPEATGEPEPYNGETPLFV